MSFSFYRMRGRSGPVSESKFELKTLKVSNDTLNVSARLIFQLHAKNHKNKPVFFLLDILLHPEPNMSRVYPHRPPILENTEYIGKMRGIFSKERGKIWRWGGILIQNDDIFTKYKW